MLFTEGCRPKMSRVCAGLYFVYLLDTTYTSEVFLPAVCLEFYAWSTERLMWRVWYAWRQVLYAQGGGGGSSGALILS